MNKYEKLIEYIVNDEQAKAKALFHEIVVEKSRDIYESMMDDEDQHMGGDKVEGMVDEITTDEEGMHEADDEMDMSGDDEIGTDSDMGDDMGSDDMDSGEGGDIEDRVMDLESALDELKAEFDALMSDEAGDDMGGMDDMGGDDMGGDDMGMGMDDEENESMMYEDKPKKGVNPFAKDDDDEEEEEDDEKAKTESRRNMSSAEKLREYVDKVSDGHGAEKSGAGEGHEVGKGGSVGVNKQGIVAKKNDMGGTAANIAKGGSEQAADGTSPKGKAGGFVKPAQEIDVAKRNVNKVGGNKGAQNYYSKKETSWDKAHGKEGQTTDGSVPVSKNSPLAK
jgi:hypothetical protein